MQPRGGGSLVRLNRTVFSRHQRKLRLFHLLADGVLVWLAFEAAYQTRSLLPLAKDSIKADEGQHGWDYIYEPDAQSVIDELLVRYLEALVYQSVAENIASEQAARMVAMKAATDNAGSVIGELKLIYNKTRQAAITKELSEIVAGAAAV